MDKVRWTGSALALVLFATGAGAQVAPDPAPPAPNDLRDFRIDPQPVPPPPPPPPPAAETPVPAPVPEPAPAPSPAPVVEDAVPPVQVDPAPPRRTPRTVNRTNPVRAQPRDPAPAQVDEAPVAETLPVVPQDLAPVAQTQPAVPVVTNAPPPAAVQTEEDTSGSLLPIALGIALAALLAGLLWHRRKRAIVPDNFIYITEDAPEPELIESDPVPAAIPQAHVARPNLSIAFTPAAAGATDAIASVDYALVVTNTGDAPASKVRMEARMFAMGPDHDTALAAFFAGPLVTPTPIASAVPPGVEAALRAQVTLPRDAVNPIQVRDRTVFVPLVAFNLLYEWYDADGGLQHGQTAMSYVVGRENRPPAAKMAPFRLDQGPRIYREVGQRVHQLRQVA